MGKQIQNKLNQRHGYLVVIGFEGTRRISTGKMRAHWRCACDCGNEVVLDTGFLRKQGGNQSCGCKHLTNASKFAGVIRRIYKHQHEKSLQKRRWTTGRTFTLTVEDVKRLIYSDCHYCGVPPSNRSKQYEVFPWNGIDRVDNTLGYIPDNCVPCCKVCNYAKNKMTLSEFQEWIQRIANHQIRKGNARSTIAA